MSATKRLIEQSDPRFAPSTSLGMDTTERIASADFDQLYERIRDEEEKIIAEEGYWCVEKVLYADQRDASKQRMWLAEQRARESIRREKIDLTRTFVEKERRAS